MSDIAKELVQAGNAHKYYYTAEWVHLQPQVMAKYKRECIRCKCLHNKVERAYILHHVMRLRGFPEYADQEFVVATTKDRLMLTQTKRTFRQYYDGSFVDIAWLQDKYGERYFIKGIDRVIQLLPVCRQCHKEIHRQQRVPKAGSLDERFAEFI